MEEGAAAAAAAAAFREKKMQCVSAPRGNETNSSNRNGITSDIRYTEIKCLSLCESRDK